jgi:hypothetical protein
MMHTHTSLLLKLLQMFMTMYQIHHHLSGFWSERIAAFFPLHIDVIPYVRHVMAHTTAFS